MNKTSKNRLFTRVLNIFEHSVPPAICNGGKGTTLALLCRLTAINARKCAKSAQIIFIVSLPLPGYYSRAFILVSMQNV